MKVLADDSGGVVDACFALAVAALGLLITI